MPWVPSVCGIDGEYGNPAGTSTTDEPLMGPFCGDVRASFGGSGPKNRNGRVVENGLFPHLDSFTEDRQASPLNIPSERASTSSLSKSSTTIPPTFVSFLRHLLTPSGDLSESNYAHCCWGFEASPSLSCSVFVSIYEALLVPSTEQVVKAGRSNSNSTRYKRLHAPLQPALLACTHHHDRSHLVFRARTDQC